MKGGRHGTAAALISLAVCLSAQSCSVLRDAVFYRELRDGGGFVKTAPERPAGAELMALADSGRVTRGMTPRMVRRAWGPPDHGYTGKLDRHPKLFTQWVYPDRLMYVYFLDGRVTAAEPMMQAGIRR